MSQTLLQHPTNTNATNFEELVTSLASLFSLLKWSNGDFNVPIAELERLYKRALHQPPCSKDVTELTGGSMNTNDRRSGRGAWLLQNIEGLRVYGVYSLLWHEVKKV